MRILHIISQRPDSTGSGIYIQELLKGSTACGNSNRLIAGIQSGDYPHLDMLPSENCRFIEFGSKYFTLRIPGMSDVMPYPSIRFGELNQQEILQYEHHFSRVISDVVSSFQPDIIHSHHLWLVSSLTARLFPHIPLVTTCHGSDLRQFNNCPHLQQRVLSGCKYIHAVLALSSPQKTEISRLYSIPENRIHIVGGGYNSQLFYQTAKVSPKPVRMLYAGKLSNAKGVPWFLQALSQLNPNDYHLDLVGGGAGPEYEQCRNLAEQYPENITIHGAVTQQRLSTLMREAHVMVLPSLYEGLPLIMLEAIASGCRVIATDLPGTREISSFLQKTPYIDLIPSPRCSAVDKVITEDEPLFVTTLKTALAKVLPEVEQEQNLDLIPISDKIRHYSWEQVFQRTLSIYEELLPLAKTSVSGHHRTAYPPLEPTAQNTSGSG